MDKKMMEQMTQEAALRLQLLNVDSATLVSFVNDNQLTKIYMNHEGQWLGKRRLTDEEKGWIHKIEEDYNILIYYVILDDGLWPDGCSFPRYTFLCVNEYQKDWEFEREECILRCGTVPAYIFNMEDPDCSEFAEICAVQKNGMIMNGS